MDREPIIDTFAEVIICPLISSEHIYHPLPSDTYSQIPRPPSATASVAQLDDYARTLCVFRESIIIGVSGTIGGGCFVTMMVLAVIIWASPNDVCGLARCSGLGSFYGQF